MRKKIVFACLAVWSFFASAEDDEYFRLAQSAYQVQAYDLCLASLKGSPLAKEARGLELERLCKERDLPTPDRSKTPYQLYAKGRAGRSDNINLSASPEAQSTYAFGVGGEYSLHKVIDFGLGASYDLFNSSGSGSSRGHTTNVFIPLGFSYDRHQLVAQLFHSRNTTDHISLYSEKGFSIGYSLLLPKITLSVSNSHSDRRHDDDQAAYQTGSYHSLQLNGIYFFEKLALGLGLNWDRNNSGDIPYGASRTLPLQHTAQGYSLSAAYSFNDISKLTARYKSANLDFNNLGGNGPTKREDKARSSSLTYLHVFSPIASAYVQFSHLDNSSTFDKKELEDRNYTENLTSVGFNVNTP